MLLNPQQTMQALQRHRCTGSGRPIMAASTMKAYVATALATLKHYCESLHTKPAYRRVRRVWVQLFTMFTQLYGIVLTHTIADVPAGKLCPAAATDTCPGPTCAGFGTLWLGAVLSACCWSCTPAA